MFTRPKNSDNFDKFINSSFFGHRKRFTIVDVESLQMCEIPEIHDSKSFYVTKKNELFINSLKLSEFSGRVKILRV